MGRYTSVQTFSDRHTKVVQAAPASTTSSGRAVAPTTDRVMNVSGSTAGASSSEFHIYRASRQRELTRIEIMETEERERKEREDFASKVERNRAEADSMDKQPVWSLP